MRLLSVRIRGAIGVYMGLRKDDVSIDFTKTGPGLLGFVGAFGCGKSTVLANLHPFRSVPGHKGGFARQYRLKDSCRDVLYQIGDDQYRFLIEINAAAAKPFVKSTVYKNGEPLNLDGGEKSYNEQVEKLFGSEGLYFASAFMAQSPLSFSSMIPSERSAAILQLFNCEHYQVKCDAAKLAGQGVTDQISKVNTVIEQLENSLIGYELLATRITEAQLGVTGYEDSLRDTATAIQTAEAEYERLQSEWTAQQVTRSQLEAAKLRLEELKKQQNKEGAEYCLRLNGLQSKVGSLKSEFRWIDIECMPERLGQIESDIDAAEKTKAAYLGTVEDRQRYNELFSKHVDAKTAYDLAKQKYGLEQQATQSAIDRAKRDVKILETVPCQLGTVVEGAKSAIIGGKESYFDDDEQDITAVFEVVKGNCASCQFIKNAVAIKPEIEILEARAATDNRIWAEKAVELQTTINAYAGAIRDLGFDPINADQLRAEHQRYENLNPAAQKHQYDIAIEKRGSLAQQGIEAEKQLAALKAEYLSTYTDMSEAVEGCKSDGRKLASQIDAALEDQVRDAGIAIGSSREEQRYFTEQLATVKATLATLQENKERADVANAQLQAEKVKLGVLQSHLADWDHLAASLSRNGGFQSMLIESLGVQMTPFCDELLAMYGRPWTMEILTSMESITTKGKLDDGFWVFVNRPEGRTELKDLSGGEEKIVDEILQSAAMLLLRQRSGLPIETVIRDEGDGALDPEGALQYFNNVQAAHKVSGVYQTLIVTHRQELIDMVSQRLRFVPGEGIKLEVE